MAICEIFPKLSTKWLIYKLFSYFLNLSNFSMYTHHNIYAIQDGWTPLMYAAREGHPGVVKILHDLGADIDHHTEVNF